MVDRICSCEFIISSSLHGLILADAYGVPNQWVRFSDKFYGGSFKFEDYFSSVGREQQPIIVDSGTTVGDIAGRKDDYRPISFDPLPLLRACPFEITHAALREMIDNQPE